MGFIADWFGGGGGGGELQTFAPPPAGTTSTYAADLAAQISKEKTAAAANARSKQSKRAGTTLTGPRGVQDQQAAVGKTFLGS